MQTHARTTADHCRRCRRRPSAVFSLRDFLFATTTLAIRTVYRQPLKSIRRCARDGKEIDNVRYSCINSFSCRGRSNNLNSSVTFSLSRSFSRREKKKKNYNNSHCHTRQDWRKEFTFRMSDGPPRGENSWHEFHGGNRQLR